MVVGPANSNSCKIASDTCLYLCDELEVPIECLKAVRPSTCLIYLGYVLDSLKLELRLPREKHNKVLNELTFWSIKRAGRKRKLLSLIGLLQHCAQAIPLGSPFLCRLIDHTHCVKQLDHFACLPPWEKDDIDWWYRLILNWNGKSLVLFSKWGIGPGFIMSSDAAGGIGLGAYLGAEWFAARWPMNTTDIDKAIKEMILLVIAAKIWGKTWECCHILFCSDNMAVVFNSLVPNANSDSLPVPTSLLHKLLFPPWTTNGLN